MPDYSFERAAAADGYAVACGVDEAGRGPLAGPVCAAAVILEPDCVIDGLDDSKKLSEKKREALFDVIRQKAVAYCVCFADEKEIDSVNILNATFLAMRRAVNGLKVKPDLAIIDGNRTPGDMPCDCRTVVKGDSKSMSVAAASVLAKVSRDRLMMKYDEMYPQYMFAKHKGYPTALHFELVRRYGPCPIHRLTFLKKLL